VIAPKACAAVGDEQREIAAGEPREDLDLSARVGVCVLDDVRDGLGRGKSDSLELFPTRARLSGDERDVVTCVRDGVRDGRIRPMHIRVRVHAAATLDHRRSYYPCKPSENRAGSKGRRNRHALRLVGRADRLRVGASRAVSFCTVSEARPGEGRERTLDERDLALTWHEQLELWLAEATAAELPEATAMVLATADADAVPSARTVLLKELSAGGLSFYTNLGSRKGMDIAANPRAALVFPWFAIARQVIAAGTVQAVDADTADAYFASRSYGSRISAHASRQSTVIRDRALLETAHAELCERYPPSAQVPRPEDWGGFRVVPSSVEFWQGRGERLHDRLRYRLDADGDWLIERLSP